MPTSGSAPTAAAGTSATATFITEERLQEVLRFEAEKITKVASVIKFQSPYSNQVLSKPYPKDCIKPKLRKFDGRKGNPREHIVSYIDDLGKYVDDENLRLREFSKSLTDKAYSWFVNLLANSIKDWDELVNAFCTKFFIAAPKVEIVDLSKDPQRKGESPSSYVLRFKERALDCRDTISETSLVGICVSDLQSKYQLHIENHSIPDFSELMIRVKNTEASLNETDKEEPHGGIKRWNNKPPFLKRKREINVVEQSSRDRRNVQNNRDREIPARIPLERYQIEALIKAWIEDGQLRPKPMQKQPTLEEKRDPRYCADHRMVNHATSDCYVIGAMYHDKVQKGEIMQPAEKNPFPSHK